MGESSESASLYHAMPSIPELLSSGFRAQQEGRVETAEQTYRHVLSLDPNNAAAWRLLGALAGQCNRNDLAVEYIGQALTIKSDYAEAWVDLGVALAAQGKLKEAVEKLRQGVRLDPTLLHAYLHLGNALSDLEQYDEAVQCFRRAIELKPDYVEVIHNLGLTLRLQGNVEKAAAAYRRVLELRPDSVPTYVNLGAIAMAQEEFDEAHRCYRKAVMLDPNCAEAHHNFATVLCSQGLVIEALSEFRRAIEIKPNYWSARSMLTFSTYFAPNWDAGQIYQEHRRWTQQFEPSSHPVRSYANVRSPNRRLRVGFVSPDFRAHCQSFFTIPLFSALDREQYEVACFSDVLSPDAMTNRIRGLANDWKDTARLSTHQFVELVRQNQIDILVDLTMHMESNRLLAFACKPAPVQVSWLAYPGTTGLTTIDYRLTDPYLDPPGMFDICYSEKSIRLTDSFWCYDPLTSVPAMNDLPAKTAGHLTFGSLNGFMKVNDDVLKLWARVLHAVDNSRMLLLAPAGSCRERVAETLQKQGVPLARIQFVSRQPRDKYLELYHQIDVQLEWLFN